MEWTQLLALIIANATLIIPLWLWSRAESRADMRHLEAMVDAQLTGMRNEMKDFHGKLERQDAEFKGKLALQDAEFKAHLMYSHSSVLEKK